MNTLEQKMEERFEELAIMIAKGFAEVKAEDQATRAEIQKLKRGIVRVRADLLEKLASQEQVDRLELRLQALEGHAH